MRNLLLTLIILISLNSFSQNEKVNFNFIICIDEHIVSKLQSPTILVKKNEQVIKSIDLSYYPGSLTMYKNNFIELNQLNNDEIIYLCFSYNDYSNNNQNILFYEVEMGKNWFNTSYLILNLYNTFKKKYRKKLEPLSGKEYTFDLETSNGQMIRLRKK